MDKKTRASVASGFCEFDEKSRTELAKVIREIKEQYLVNNRQDQFWFYPEEISDVSLSRAIVVKWLKVLAGRGVLYCYFVSNPLEYERDCIVSRQKLSDKHDWDITMFPPVLFCSSAGPRPNIALDLLGSNLDVLLDALKREDIWGGFSKDALGDLYYCATPLLSVSRSVVCRQVLLALLAAEGHALTAEQMMNVLIGIEEMQERKTLGPEEKEDFVKDPRNITKRNRAVSDINKALRLANGAAEIVSHKTGRRVSYYELIAK